MHHSNLKNISKNITLKAIALFFGYHIWLSISSYQNASHTLTVPICIYNKKKETIISTPETVAITLQGKRKYLRLAMMHNDLCIHIDGNSLHLGDQYIIPTAHHLLLPEEISISLSTPLKVTATLT